MTQPSSFVPADRTGPRAELSRLWSYRLGFTGVHAKYRFVPRSAIVAYDDLEGAVRSWNGEAPLEDTIRTLWQRHGAPSPGVVDGFLAIGRQLDRCSPHASQGELDALVARAAGLVGGRSGRTTTSATNGVEAANRGVLALWLEACAPRSRLAAASETLEVAFAFVVRRVRQRSLRRPGSSGREAPRTTR